MADAVERKRKRLDAWRKRQAQSKPPPVKLSLSISKPTKKKAPKPTPAATSFNAFGDADDEDDGDDEAPKKAMLMDFNGEESAPNSRKRRRWDVENVGDALDSFMEKLTEGAMGSVSTQQAGVEIKVDVSGSMMRLEQPTTSTALSGQVATADQVAAMNIKNKPKGEAIYAPSDWESEATSGAETEDEEEEDARRKFIEALKSAPAPKETQVDEAPAQLQTAAEVKTEKQRREERLKQLEHEAEAARHAAAAAPEFGRMFNDAEDGVMEEAERNLDAAMAAPDALEVLAELNKKKELTVVDHSKIDYINFRKNLYIVPRAVANMTQDEIINRRAKQKIRVRGQGAPTPVTTFSECGVSERICRIMEKQGIGDPYPVQSQCIPCIMAGRDVIGIAKTGSGKTLAYLLPLLRHIGDQPPLAPQESGPIGLILAPARELAAQIHSVCKVFCKHLGYK
jgi:hypothetical protein